MAMREADDGCTLAADRLYDHKLFNALDIWRKARLMIEHNRPRTARNAVQIVAPDAANVVQEVHNNASKFLSKHIAAPQKVRQELIVMALVRIATADPDDAAKLMRSKWQPYLTSEERHWVWGVIGRQAAMQLNNDALDHYAQAGNGAHLTDDMLAWKVRAALRADSTPQWSTVESAIKAMSPAHQKEAAWVYWLARAEMAKQPKGSPLSPNVATALQSIAGPQGFYEQLAEEELGRKIMAPARPPAPTAQEMVAIKSNPSLQRAMHAIRIGLRADGVREWNYATGLVDGMGKKGRMGEREKLAAAQWACEQEIWDRCINTSERSSPMDVGQRYPMPYKDQVVERTKDIDLEAAYVYGLIRQESRFVMDARSSVWPRPAVSHRRATARPLDGGRRARRHAVVHCVGPRAERRGDADDHREPARERGARTEAGRCVSAVVGGGGERRRRRRYVQARGHDELDRVPRGARLVLDGLHERHRHRDLQGHRQRGDPAAHGVGDDADVPMSARVVGQPRAFSLIEVMVALVISAIVLSTVVGVLTLTLRDNRRTRVHTEMLREAVPVTDGVTVPVSVPLRLRLSRLLAWGSLCARSTQCFQCRSPKTAGMR
jgi:prepilin-type N-terminal cleavage/methylation domain-containing protein